MPEIRFDVRWPDGSLERCYSPSLVVCELLPQGEDLPVFEFMERVRAALRIGSERVRLKYGYCCSAALDQLQSLERRAVEHDNRGPMQVLAYYEGGYLPPLGAAEPGPSERKPA